MKFLVILSLICCAYARPGGHGWAPAPAPAPVAPARTYHIIREVVQARPAVPEPPPQVIHVTLEQAPPQVQHSAPPQLFHVKLQPVAAQHSAPPPPPPQVIKVIQQHAPPAPPPQTGGNGWW